MLVPSWSSLCGRLVDTMLIDGIATTAHLRRNSIVPIIHLWKQMSVLNVYSSIPTPVMWKGRNACGNKCYQTERYAFHDLSSWWQWEMESFNTLFVLVEWSSCVFILYFVCSFILICSQRFCATLSNIRLFVCYWLYLPYCALLYSSLQLNK